MSVVEVVLPYPPQVNHIHTVVRGRKIMSSKYRAWRKIADWTLCEQFLVQIKGNYTAVMTFDRPDRRKRDVSNLAKACEDALVSVGLVQDDSYCDRLTLEWSGPDPVKNPMARIVIREA